MAVPEHTAYYLEIVTDDVEGAQRLYSTAYGWRFEAKGPEWGDSLVATLPDGSLCGIRGPLSPEEAPTVRTYLRVADIEAAVRDADHLGAEIALEPMDLAGQGQIAIYRHGGIEQGLWQLPRRGSGTPE